MTELHARCAPLLRLGRFSENYLAGGQPTASRRYYLSKPAPASLGARTTPGTLGKARYRLLQAPTVRRWEPPWGLPTAAPIPLPEDPACREKDLPRRRRPGGGWGRLVTVVAPPPHLPPRRRRPLGGRRWIGGGRGRGVCVRGEASPPLRSARCGRRLLLSAALRPLRLSNDAVLARDDDRERRGTEPLPLPPQPGALSLARLPGTSRLPGCASRRLPDGRQEERAEGRRWFYGEGFVLSRCSVPRRAGLFSSSASSCRLPPHTRPAGSGSSCFRRHRRLRGPWPCRARAGRARSRGEWPSPRSRRRRRRRGQRKRSSSAGAAAGEASMGDRSPLRHLKEPLKLSGSPTATTRPPLLQAPCK